MKKGLSLFLSMVLIIGSSSMVFASETSFNDICNLASFQQKVSSLQSPISEGYKEKVEQLLKDTDPQIVEQFINDKLAIAETKMNNYTPKLLLNGITNDYIDLGDNCFIKVTVEDVSEAIDLYANTPGAETLWKNYGDRKFTVTYDVFAVVVYYNINLVNHYTLSSNGIKVRYGDAYVADSGIGHGIAGNINITKSSATVGQTVSMNCIFVLRAGLEGVGINKNFKIFNNVKCSEIDTLEKQVKVVQSWNGDWL